MIAFHATLALLNTAALGVSSSVDDSWPHIRGAQFDGRTQASIPFDAGVELQVAWRAQLGPSYSGIAAADGLAVTCFSDGTSDFVIALSTKDGGERWRYRLGETYRGHDGSEDGPISSPSIDAGRVFALGPLGTFVALDLNDGSKIWSKELPADFGSPVPDYGFTTSPLAVGGVVILQTGGDDGRSITGFDPATGTVRWSIGDNRASYQSPVAMELAGRLQVIVLDGKRILSVAPEDGSTLWQHTFEAERESVSSGFATYVDPQRFAASVSGTLAMFEVSEADGAFEVREAFRSRELGRSYATPVAHDGYLYGFKSDFLTCIDGSTGKRVWKSRPPGGRGLILVDDRLIVFGAEGVVAVVKASPEDYIEEARTTALSHTGYTWPSFLDGQVLVRNSSELVSVGIVESKAGGLVAASASDVGAPSDFGRFLEEAASSSNPQGLVDTFMAQNTSFPILEGNLMHVVFRGDVDDVAVSGTMIEGGRPQTMEHVEGTNFYHRTFEIEPKTRWEYRFQVNFEDMVNDELNPNTVPGNRGAVLSEFATPDYARAAHFNAPVDRPRGRLDSYEFASEQLGTTRNVKVYLPAGYDDSDARYPLLIVHRGSSWIDNGELPNTLDNLIDDSVAPLIVAFIDPIDQWWFEGGGSETEAYVDMLATEFLGDLGSRYRLTDTPSERALMGHRSFALTAMLGALRHPEAFGKAAVQSVSLADVARHALFEAIEGEKVDAQFYVDWNRFGSKNLDAGQDYAADSRRLSEALRAKGYGVAGGEAHDSYGWGSWRARSNRILEAFFPAGGN